MVSESDAETLEQHQQNIGEHSRDQEEGSLKESSKSVGFWSKDLKDVRSEVFKKWVLTTLVLSTFILAILSLYWAVLLRVEQNLSSLVVWVVDFDGVLEPYTDTTPVVGPMIVKTASSLVAPSGSLGWGSLPPSHFNNDPMAVRQAIYDEYAWAAIIINANATALLQEAVTTGNSSYDPMGAAQVIYIQARDETTYGNYVIPQINKFETMVSAQFGRMWAKEVLIRAGSTPSILANIQEAPQAISPAIGFSTFNLRPFSPPVHTPAITIGLIYLIIISFFSFSFFLPVHMKFIQTPGCRPLHFYQLIIWRYVATLADYFFLAFFYSIISLAFQINFTAPPASGTVVANPATAYGHRSFVVYWMVNFVGMIVLGLASENVAMVVGQPFTSFWLIFWVISNVSTSFYSITLAPHFYYWGYAWPLHHIVNASRTILFDIHSRIGLNFGVLFAWAAVNTILFPLCCYFMRWKTMRQKKKEAQKKSE